MSPLVVSPSRLGYMTKIQRIMMIDWGTSISMLIASERVGKASESSPIKSKSDRAARGRILFAAALQCSREVYNCPET